MMFDRRTAPSEEIDVSEEEHVAWIRSQRDASLWHQATMAALAALTRMISSPGSSRSPSSIERRLGGCSCGPRGPALSAASGTFTSRFEREDARDLSRDSIGLNPDFEPERLRALDVVARGEVSPRLVLPRVLLDRPFPRERPEKPFVLDDGLLLLSDDIIALLT
jgi:hypothetical protein